jgi:hypothetical protein
MHLSPVPAPSIMVRLPADGKGFLEIQLLRKSFDQMENITAQILQGRVHERGFGP